MLIEMNILGLWARSLYKKPLPEAFLNSNIEQVCVIPTVHATVEKQINNGEATQNTKQNNNAQGYANNNFIDAKL